MRNIKLGYFLAILVMYQFCLHGSARIAQLSTNSIYSYVISDGAVFRCSINASSPKHELISRPFYVVSEAIESPANTLIAVRLVRNYGLPHISIINLVYELAFKFSRHILVVENIFYFVELLHKMNIESGCFANILHFIKPVQSSDASVFKELTWHLSFDKDPRPLFLPNEFGGIFTLFKCQLSGRGCTSSLKNGNPNKYQSQQPGYEPKYGYVRRTPLRGEVGALNFVIYYGLIIFGLYGGGYGLFCRIKHKVIAGSYCFGACAFMVILWCICYKPY